MHTKNRIALIQLQLTRETPLLFLFPMLCACAYSAPLQRHAVQVSLTGDDGLTQAFSVGLKEKLARTKTFVVVSTSEKARFRVTSDTNVEPIDRANQALAYYQIHVTDGEHRIGTIAGECPKSVMSRCAGQAACDIEALVSRIR